MNALKDLTGQKFGLLTVVGRGEDYIAPSGKKRPRWICKCECGGETLCQSGTLHAGKVRSCGCLQKDNARRQALTGTNRRIDITGERFGRLVAIKPVSSDKNNGVIWLCKCDCGCEVLQPVKRLRNGGVLSCGCLRNDTISEVNKKHNKSHKSRLYNVWLGMRQRCNDQNHKSFVNYGGRGIKVCDEWDNFDAFEQWAMSNGYKPDAPYGECTLDRVNVDGNYEPSNCRWVDAITQAHNKRAKQ